MKAKAVIQGWLRQIYLVSGQVLRFGVRLFQPIIEYLRFHPPFTAVLLATLLLAMLLVLGLVIPAQQNFEADLITRSLSFTCTESNPLLLAKLYPIEQITFRGSLEYALEGAFSSSRYPQLEKIQRLKLVPQAAEATLTLTMENPQLSPFTIKALRIPQNTRVKELGYNPANHKLSLQLENQLGRSPLIELETGIIPLKVTLSGYKLLSQPPLPANPKQQWEFFWQTPEAKLSLQTPVALTIDLAAAKQPSFTGEMAVRDVKFAQLQRPSADQGDWSETPAIVAGKVRMGEAELTLREHQFLNFEPPGSIHRLRFVQMVFPKTEDIAIWGFQVAIAGQAQRVATGLISQYPVSRLGVSLLAQFFPGQAFTVFLAFLTGLMGALSVWLTHELLKSSRRGG